MQLTKTHKIIISIAVIVILTGSYIVFDIKSRKDTSEESPETIQTATTTEDTSKDLIYKVEKITKNESTSQIPQPIPDLNRPIIKSSIANVSERDTVLSTQKVKELQSLLKNNPLDFPVWMDLAMYQKLGGDYDGALISWKYAGRLQPEDSVSVANIGHLYAYFIKDFNKSEEYYKKAISINPTQSYLYTQLAEVYEDFLNDLSKAKAIIEEGLQKIPLDPNLLEFKASLK